MHDWRVLVAALALLSGLIGALAVSLWLGRRADRERRRLEAARLEAEEKARAADEAARIASVAARLAETEAARAKHRAAVAEQEAAVAVAAVEEVEKTKPIPIPAKPPSLLDLPLHVMVSTLFRIFAGKWWETPEGRRRMGEWRAEQERKRGPREPGPDEF